MTFKELALDSELSLSSYRHDGDQAFWERFVNSQSPVIKLWFVIMAVNFILVLCLI